MSCKTYARRVTMSTALEIERKYIIRIPNEALLRLMNSYTESLITQTYLCPSPGETRRVRRREYADHTVFTKTTKRRVDGISSVECEDVITESEYLSLLTEIEPGTHPIEKKRKTFLCNPNGRISVFSKPSLNIPMTVRCLPILSRYLPRSRAKSGFQITRFPALSRTRILFMIPFAGEYSEGAIYRLEKNNSHQLMRKSHF